MLRHACQQRPGPPRASPGTRDATPTRRAGWPGITSGSPLLSLVVPTRRLPRAAAFWSVAVLLVLMLAASGVPSPLYRVYQEEFGFSSGVLTTVFGIYSFALLASLLVVGGLSDHVGRRPVLIVAFVLEAAAMALFLVADGVELAAAPRGSCRAWPPVRSPARSAPPCSTCSAATARSPPSSTAPPRASASSLGAVGAGLLVQFVPSPTDWVFGVLTVVFVLAAVGTWLLPESSPRLPGAVASLRPRVHVPPVHRRHRSSSRCRVLVATWALGGFYASLGPVAGRRTSSASTTTSSAAC